jgi:hypothetical protein
VRRACAIHKPRACNGKYSSSIGPNVATDFRKMCHFPCKAAAVELRQRGFVLGPYCFPGVQRGQSTGERHGRHEITFRIHPQNFAAKRQVSHGVTVERKLLALHRNDVASG